MIYKSFQDMKISAMGLGCMRLPVIDGENDRIDTLQTERMIAYCMEKGVNYYDTAWGYHGGKSEQTVGAALKKYPRDSYYLADKFPGYDPGNWPKVKEIFAAQLERCGVDYFDFYMFHNVCEMNIDAYLDPKYGVFEYLMQMKKEGKIRHLGFSAHGDLPVMQRFLDAYGSEMEFCQIELNYFDWLFQRGKEKVELLRAWNIPIWVMEPVRGGQLANLDAPAEARLKAMRPDESVVSWAFRFLQDIDDAVVTLSGASSFEQLQENIATYETRRPLSDPERDTLLGIAREMIEKTAVGCTACRYCVSHCPKGIDIPMLLKLYNEALIAGAGDFIAPMALSAVDKEKRPSACIGCRSCETVCPQQLKISEHLAAFAERMKKK